jgi:hypothetical protein
MLRKAELSASTSKLDDEPLVAAKPNSFCHRFAVPVSACRNQNPTTGPLFEGEGGLAIRQVQDNEQPDTKTKAGVVCYTRPDRLWRPPRSTVRHR